MNSAKYFILFLVIFCSCRTDYYPTETTSSFTVLTDSLQLKDQVANDLIRPYKDSVDKIMNEVIGVSGHEMITAKPQGTLGNFVADLLYYDLPLNPKYNHLNYSSFFVLLNTRGLRARLPKGDITRGKIFEIMPFENQVVIAKMPAESFYEVGEFIAGAGGHPVSRNVYLLANEGQVEQFTINFKKPASDFYIVTSDYLASGGDNMHFFKKAKEIIPTGLLIRDLILSHIEKLTSKKHIIQSVTDDRILLFR
jgi:2',3'-cyclic-nucleotide 2'-phosphodiesterase (5'-nucleotidase family)